MTIDTDDLSARLRARSIDPTRRKILITRLADTAQEPDLSEPTTCSGYGRIRHFKRATSEGWPDNPLPIDPACAALDLPRTDELRVQLFQNASCNWRCWYCYVPFTLLGANEKRSSWFGADELVDAYLAVEDRPAVIDLSGGQPDLVPEWTAWMARELTERGLAGDVYLWVDDNLSNDYYWTKIADDDRTAIDGYPAFGRVGCFKGYDAESFAFNTSTTADVFDRQFELMARHIAAGTDCYGYVTFTSPTTADPTTAVREFVDRLQSLDELFPLRVVPLEIEVWGPVQPRIRAEHELALRHQHDVVSAWNAELERRFDADLRGLAINDVPLHGRR